MTKNRLFRRLISCALIVHLSALSPMGIHAAHAAAPSSPLVIGEVAWAGSSLSTSDEWLEIWNISDDPISLVGWSLRGASDTPLPLPQDATIAPRDLFLVSNYVNGDAKSVLATTTHLVTTAVSLSNSKLGIDLIDPSGAIVDSANTGGSPLAGSSTPIKATMIRMHPEIDGGMPEAWTTATTTVGIRNDVTDLGTPGLCDACGTAKEQSPVTTETLAEALTATTTDTGTQNVLTATSTTEIDINATSSTSASQENMDAASTTTPIMNQGTTSTVSAQTNTPTNTNVTQPDAPPKPIEPPKPAYGMLRLNKVMPDPASGKEWFEMVTLDIGNSINLKGCTVFDSQGKIMTIGSKTIDPTITRTLTISFTSSRLNNDGDSVSLYAPDGRLLDTMTYKTSQKGMAWSRVPEFTGEWQLPATNIAAVSVSTTTSTSAATEKTTATDTLADTETKLMNALAEPVIDEPDIEEPAVTEAAVPSEPTIPTKSIKIKTPKTSATKTRISNPTPIIPISFDMFTDTNDMHRIRLTGRVGSPLGLTAGRTFVLQNPDGRGILVTVPANTHLPRYDHDVTISGTFHLDEQDVASVKLTAKDLMIDHGTSTKPISPRIVDLLLPSAEDAWSLIDVTGTVVNVSGATVHLDVDGGDLDMLIKPLLKYRAKRLIAGDVIAVRGVVDTTRETPRILPRESAEIRIISRAPTKTEKIQAGSPITQSPTLPGWTPIGAAIGAIGVTEGAKRVHRHQKMKRLEKKLASI